MLGFDVSVNLSGTSGVIALRRRPRRSWLVLVFVLSLVAPGAGHFLRGSLRRGFAWALALTGLGLAFIFAMPITFLTIAIFAVVGPLAILACALDALRLSDAMRPWKILLVSWAALLVSGWLVEEPLKSYYKTHYARAFTISSGSMEPALSKGDYVLTNNSAYRAGGPQRGDIVVFKYPRDEQREFIKRVVGIPGDRIEIRARQVIINGSPLDEPYVKRGNSGAANVGQSESCSYTYGCDLTVVPADAYFVMGDNRDNSQDSRHWGFVRRDKIVGRAFAIYWSWDSARRWPRLDRVGKSLEAGDHG